MVVEDTYHEHLPEDVCARLRCCNDAGSLYVRGRADRLAVHRTKELSVCWDVKIITPNYENLTIELSAFCYHLLSDVPCLYIYKRTANSRRGESIGAFWSTKLPKIAPIQVPTRWRNQTAALTVFGRLARKAFGAHHKCQWVHTRQGSGTPYVLIRAKELEEASCDWEADVRRALRDGLDAVARPLTQMHLA